MVKVALHEILGRQVVELEPPYRFDDLFVFLMHDGPGVRLVPDNKDGRRFMRDLRRAYFNDTTDADHTKNFGIGDYPLTPDEETDDPTDLALDERERHLDEALIFPDVACYMMRRRGKQWWDVDTRMPHMTFWLPEPVLELLNYTAFAMGGTRGTVREVARLGNLYPSACAPEGNAYLAELGRVRSGLERTGTTLTTLEIKTGLLARVMGVSVITSRTKSLNNAFPDLNLIPYNKHQPGSARRPRTRARVPRQLVKVVA